MTLAVVGRGSQKTAAANALEVLVDRDVIAVKLAAPLALLLASGACEPSPATDPIDPAQRVVPACASAVDYLCALGVQDRIVALPSQALEYSSGLSPGTAARVPTFAAFRSEAVLGLRPHLVVCDWYQTGATTELLRQRGMAVVALAEVDGLHAIAANLRAVGEAVERAAEATALAARFEADGRALLADVPAERPRILPYLNHGTGARTAGTGTLEDLMIALAGGRNAAAELGMSGHGPLPAERVITAPPDFFLTGDRGQVAALRASPSLRALPAVREGRVLSLPKRYRDATSPYVLDAARALRRMLVEKRAR